MQLQSWMVQSQGAYSWIHNLATPCGDTINALHSNPTTNIIVHRMFGFFGKKSTKCPIDADQRRWIDARFNWLLGQFGSNAPQTAPVVLPTPEFFPDEFKGEPEDVPAMFARVANYMGVDAGKFSLYLYSENEQRRFPGLGLISSGGTAGLYHQPAAETDQSTIGFELSQLRDPTSLVATMAHEIGHELLLGQGRVSPEDNDHEPLTDLLTIFRGFGVFTANSTLQDRSWSDGMWSGWETKRLGYLDQRMIGYALAKFAFARHEVSPAWQKHIRPDVRQPMKESLRVLAVEASQ